jgi:hypothetical protein
MRLRVAIIVLCISGALLGGLCSCSTGFFSRTTGSYLAGVETSLEKVFKDPDKVKAELSEVAIVKAARNEYESFQIILLPHGGDLKNIRIEPTQLTCHERGEVIERENISFYQVGYVETKRPAYNIGFVGWWPDPLFPLRKFDVENGTVQPIWVTIYVPSNTSTGLYEGSIRIIPENARAETVEVSVTVWNFTLPEEPSLQAVFSLYEDNIQHYYKFDVVPPDLLRKYYSFLLAHRINPTNLYLRGRPQPKLEDFQYCVDRGMNAMNIAYLYDRQHIARDKGHFSEEMKRTLVEELPNIVSFLKERQWLHKSFIYGPDEPNPHHYSAVKEMFALVQRVAPGVRRVLTEPPAEELFGYVDVWVPLIRDYDEKKCRSRQELGEEIWLYVCNFPHHPYPNFFIDYPAIDHRILFWMAWKYDASGFLYYSLNRWVTNYHEGQKRWPDVHWNTFTCENYNGDGQLIYPGPDGEPYSSVRLEVIRDGIEDFEYLRNLQGWMEVLAGKEIEEAGQLLRPTEELISAIKEKLVANMTSYTKDPHEVFLYREMVAEAIEKLRSVLEGDSKF